MTEYWQLPFDQWEANTKVELPTKQFKGTDYITYHNMIRALREYVPGVVPEMLEATPLEDGTIILKLRLWCCEEGLPSQMHRIAVMALGTSSHHAKPCPDARSLQDGIRRAICRVISEETGLGYQLWLRDEDEYEAQPAQQQQQQMPWDSQQQVNQWLDNIPDKQPGQGVFDAFVQQPQPTQAVQPPQRQRL